MIAMLDLRLAVVESLDVFVDLVCTGDVSDSTVSATVTLISTSSASTSKCERMRPSASLVGSRG